MATTNAEHYLGDLEAASKLIPPTVPYIMMNLLKFKPHVEYASSFKGPRLDAGATGREAYIKYKNMFVQRATEMGIEVTMHLLGEAHTQIVAGPQEGESWDIVILAKYSSWKVFKSILQDEKYNKEIVPHRIAALEGFRSFAVTELGGI